MTATQKSKYQPASELRRALDALKNQKFELDCGHHVTFGNNLGNNVIIHNGSQLKIICTECGY